MVWTRARVECSAYNHSVWKTISVWQTDTVLGDVVLLVSIHHRFNRQNPTYKTPTNYISVQGEENWYKQHAKINKKNVRKSWNHMKKTVEATPFPSTGTTSDFLCRCLSSTFVLVWELTAAFQWPASQASLDWRRPGFSKALIKGRVWSKLKAQIFTPHKRPGDIFTGYFLQQSLCIALFELAFRDALRAILVCKQRLFELLSFFQLFLKLFCLLRPLARDVH